MTRCNDCGELFQLAWVQGAPVRKSKRDDVCDPCWENRGKMIEALSSGKVNHEDFKATQRALANGRGTGKRLIEKLLATLPGSPK